MVFNLLAWQTRDCWWVFFVLFLFCFGHVEADLEERTTLCFFYVTFCCAGNINFFVFFFLCINFIPHFFIFLICCQSVTICIETFPTKNIYIYIERVYIQVYDLHAFRMVFVLSNIVSNYIYVNIWFSFHVLEGCGKKMNVNFSIFEYRINVEKQLSGVKKKHYPSQWDSRWSRSRGGDNVVAFDLVQIWCVCVCVYLQLIAVWMLMSINHRWGRKSEQKSAPAVQMAQ